MQFMHLDVGTWTFRFSARKSALWGKCSYTHTLWFGAFWIWKISSVGFGDSFKFVLPSFSLPSWSFHFPSSNRNFFVTMQYRRIKSKTYKKWKCNLLKRTTVTHYIFQITFFPLVVTDKNAFLFLLATIPDKDGRS